MDFLGDYAEFRRPLGAKDKQPRKRRDWGATSAALGLAGGSVYSLGRDAYHIGRIRQMQPQDSSQAVAALKARRVSAMHSLKRGAAGAAAGLGAYGAYKGIKHLRNRKKTNR